MQAHTSAPVRVVVVEDDDRTREGLCAAVAATPGFSLTAAFGRSRPAIDWLGVHGADMLLTDLGLPDGSGIDVIRACAARWPECDVMVISMFGDEQNVLSSIQAGATGYILKGCDQIDVPGAMRDLLNGGSPMSPMIARKVLERARQRELPAPAMSGTIGAALTRRESETLDLIARGYTYQEVGGLLAVSLSTVQSHIRGIYRKLLVNSRGEAVFEAHKLGLLQSGLMEP